MCRSSAAAASIGRQFALRLATILHVRDTSPGESLTLAVATAAEVLVLGFVVAICDGEAADAADQEGQADVDDSGGLHGFGLLAC